MQQDAASANASLDARRAQLDGGAPPAQLVFRTGAIPANVGAARTGTEISRHNLSNPSAPGAANYILTFAAIAAAVASAGGTPGYYSVHQGGTNTVKVQGLAGVGPGTAPNLNEFNFPSAPALGSNVTPTGWTWTDQTA